MSGSRKTLVLIPARGGSKGLPRKNIAPLGGVPLIAWAIAAARQSPYVTDIVVSTDDEEIAQIAKAWGADVPFLRPRELAEDSSAIADATAYTLNRLGGTYDATLTLFPTHPFRSPAMLEQAVETGLTFSLGVSAATCESNEPGDFVLIGANGPVPVLSTRPGAIMKVQGLFSISTRFPRHIYDATGIDHFIARATELANPQSRFFVPEHYFFTNDPATLIDIDSAADLARAEAMIHAGQIGWSPRGDKAAGKGSRLVQQTTPAQISPSYHAVCLDTGVHVTLTLPANPLVIEPNELRSIVDHHPVLTNKAVIIGVGNTPMRTETLSTLLRSGTPTIAADLVNQISVGSGTAQHTAAYGLLFCHEELVQRAGACAGDIAAQYSNGKLIVELLPFEIPGTIVYATASDVNFRAIGHSTHYEFTNDAWQATRNETAHDQAANIFLNKTERGYVLEVPAGTAAVEFRVFRSSSQEPARGYTWDPIEFPGVMEWDRKNYCWRNCLTGASITGRQTLPPIYRWAGHVYLPKQVASNARWSISWNKDRRGDALGFSSLGK